MALSQDLKYAFRSFRKNPAFVAAAVIVLALGIGANTATFSVVDALLLRPLPFPEPSRLVQVSHVPPADAFHGLTKFAVSPANYLDWKAQSHSFENMAVVGFSNPSLTGEGNPESVLAANVESSFFPTLGIKPVLGRTFSTDEDRPDSKVVILGDALWRARYSSDPSMVGKTIKVDGESYTVVGIMPPTALFPMDTPVRMWMPINWKAEDRAIRGIHDYSVVARLRPGVSIQQAQAEMNTISKRLEELYPNDDKGWGAIVEDLRDAQVGDIRPALLMMLGAVGFVLLIACANVANLVLARTLARQKEISIRVALGASRTRLLQQALLESLMLAAFGAIAGLLLARILVPLIVNFLGEDVTRIAQIRMDWRVLLFTIAASLFTGLVAGLLPATRFLKSRNLSDSIRQGAGATDTIAGGLALRKALITAEMALSLVLLVGAGLTIRSLANLQHTDPGIDPHNTISFGLDVPEARYPQKQQRVDFLKNVLSQIRVLPGVESAGLVSSVPALGAGGSRQPIRIEGEPELPAAQQPEVAVRYASPDYFKTFRIPFIGGRDFADSDTDTSKKVIVISESLAKRFWPGKDAIGKRLILTFRPGIWWEVVGVVKDVKVVGLENDYLPTLYAPQAQIGNGHAHIIVRTLIQPQSIASSVVSTIQSIDSQQPVTVDGTMENLIDESLRQRRFNMLLLSAFAGVAVLLSAVGIYSVLSYAGRRRAREIGIRMALGAQTRDVLRLIMIEGLRPTLTGMAVGVVAALALHRVLSSIVFGVSAADPWILTATAVLLAVIALGSSAIPAWRATRVQPLSVLRED